MTAEREQEGEKMNRLILVSNRLPVSAEINKNGEIELKESAGGLATGLNSLQADLEKIWVGWPGTKDESPETQGRIENALGKKGYVPVFLSEQQYSHFYEGFCNETIWPLFHYFSDHTQFEESYRDAYAEVNQLFLHKVKEIAREGDIIWIHDYHLMLLPELLRKALPSHQIGFFLHIPFPSHEVFRICPWGDELLKGMLGADLIGFHTYGYMHHFIESASKALNLKTDPDHISYADRHIQVDAFPMGINFEKFHKAAESEPVKRHLTRFRQLFGSGKIILSVDRLDYSKGIIHRLKAYEELLRTYPELKKKALLVMVVVPSRDTIRDYQHLKEEIDEAVGKINGIYGSLDRMPVHYLYQSVPFEQLTALYRLADVALVTPLRDGMNLVSKEYVASRIREDGVLILSKMAGAIHELKTALEVNPMDDTEMVEAMMAAINMSPKEQNIRMRYMQKLVKANNVEHWAKRFISILRDNYIIEDLLERQMANGLDTSMIKDAYTKSERRMLILKYDGSLAPFVDDPMEGKPEPALLDTLRRIGNQARVILMSGRDPLILEKWFGGLNMSMVAEHGIWCKVDGIWKATKSFDNAWKEWILPILQEFTENTTHSFIEEKDYCLAWHYRRTDSWLAKIRVPQLMESLINLTTDLNLQVINGEKVVEIIPKSASKVQTIRYWVKHEQPDFILAVGDDQTDESMFRSLPDHAFTVKAGRGDTSARYRFPNREKTQELLHDLSEIHETRTASLIKRNDRMDTPLRH